MADPSAFSAAGLDALSSKINWAALFFALFAAILFIVANWLHDKAQTKRRVEEQAAIQAEGLDNPLWQHSQRQLTALGFRRHGLSRGLVLYERQPARGNDNSVPLVEAVISRNGQTIAVVDIISLDAGNAWAWASSDEMTDGATVEEAVVKSDIPLWLAQRSNDGLDVIGVGLASRATRTSAVGDDPLETAQANLVTRRAVQLVTKLRAVAGFVTGRPVQYWTLELGTAETRRGYDSPEERRQRAAIIVALSRRSNVEGGPITPDEALALITTNVNVYGTDLTDYQNSADPGAHLKALPASPR